MASNQASMVRRQRERARQQKRREKQAKRMQRLEEKKAAAQANPGDSTEGDDMIDWSAAVRHTPLDPEEVDTSEISSLEGLQES